MTISSTTRKAGPFAGNGVATAFPFAFKVFTKADVKLLKIDALGNSTTLTLDSDYSIVLSANQDTSPGGTITYPISGAALPAGYSLVALGSLLNNQLTDITNSGGFYPQTIEDMVDRSTIQIQQVAELAGRAIVVTEAENTAPVLPPALSRINTLLGFGATGQVSLMPLTASVGAGDMRVDMFTAGVDFTPGVSNSVTLSRAPGTIANTQTFFDPYFQGPDQILSLVGTVLTFTGVIPVGTQHVYVRSGTTLSIYLPPAGSVNDATLAVGSNIYALNNYHWRVRTDPNNNYDGISQSAFPEAPPLIYAVDGESFGWSMRNSKHTAFELYNSVNGLTTQFFDGVQGVTQLSAGSTIGQATGVAGYIKNQCAAVGGHPNGVALFGLGTAEVDNANTWGLNTLLQDSAVRAVGSGLGRLLLGYECDINVMNPDTQVIGISVGGNGLSQPKAANAFIANALGNGIQWGTSFWSTDGNAARSLVTGRNAALAANVASQQMWWNYGDFAGASQLGILQFVPAGGAAPGGAWVFSGTAKSGITVNNGDINAVSGVYRVASTQVVGAQVTGYGTPLNGTRQSGFNASTATLAQVAAQVAAMCVDLKAHGLFGA